MQCDFSGSNLVHYRKRPIFSCSNYHDIGVYICVGVKFISHANTFEEEEIELFNSQMQPDLCTH